MIENHIPGTWEAKLESSIWKIFDDTGNLIATMADFPDAGVKAKIIVASPYMLEALKGVVELLGDDDLPDNGEFSGGAVSDMVVTAIELAS